MPTIKRSVSEFALFGGDPVFEKLVILGKPNVPDIDAAVQDLRMVLESGVLTNNGPRVEAFEEAIARSVKAKHCVATDNATSALQLVARAMDLRGDIIVPAFTFIATANAFAWLGLRPRFVDVDPITHTIDIGQAEAAITAHTAGICGVHLWGNPCDNPALSSLAKRFDIPLIYDAAHAFGCEDSAGVRVGGFGNAEVFSFHATKFINAFEGGAVVTNEDALADKLRRIRNFGFDENGCVESVGVNAKMSEVSAAMGLHSLRYYDEIVETNRRNLIRYRKNLSDCPGIRIVAPLDPGRNNCQYAVVELDEQTGGITRDTLLTCLRAEGVVARPYFFPACHLQEAYKSDGHKKLRVTEHLARVIFCLPNGLAVSEPVVDRVSELIRDAVEFGSDIESKSRRVL